MAATAPPPILDAIRRDDAASIAVAMLQQPTLPDMRAPTGENLVLHALYHNARTVIPTLTATRTLTAVEAAALGRRDALASALERAPAQRDAWSGDGWTPLHLAAFFGETGTVADLIAVGASLAVRSRNALENTPLHAALAGSAHAAVVDALLDAGADVNAHGARDITPLHLAAARGSRALADRLIAAGADRSARMDDGNTPSALAAQRGFAELAETLAP